MAKKRMVVKVLLKTASVQEITSTNCKRGEVLVDLKAIARKMGKSDPIATNRKVETDPIPTRRKKIDI